MSQRVHTVWVTWSTHHGEMDCTFHIACPYPSTETDKPCRIWANGFEDDGEYEPGCWVQQTLDAIGWADMGMEIPPNSQSPWAMYVTGVGDDGPWLTTTAPEHAPDPPPPAAPESADDGFYRRLADRSDFDPYGIER